MADIPNWLKNFCSPVIPAATSNEKETCSDDANKNKDNAIRPSTVHRGSSYLTFGRRKTLSISTSHPPAHLTSAEEVWHNPDDIQVFETLRVILMTRSAFEPVPVQYNSCILQVLEAYENIQGVVRQKDQDFEAVEARLMKLTEEFQHQRLLWDAKENNYRKQIKKLEVTLAAGERGLDLVTMTRTNSVVYKSTADSRVDISTYQDGTKTQNGGQPGLHYLAAVSLTPQVFSGRMTVDYATKRDRHLSKKFATRIQHFHDNRDRFVQRKQHKQAGQFGALFNPVSGNDTVEVAYTAHGIYESDTSQFDHLKLHERTSISSTASSGEGDHGSVRAALGSFQDAEDSQRSSIIVVKCQTKPLPELPSNTTESDSREPETYDEDAKQQKNGTSVAQPGNRKRGFSFVPGYETLPMESTRRACIYELGTISLEDSHVRTDTAPQKKTIQNAGRLESIYSSASTGFSDMTPSVTPLKVVDAISSVERSHPSSSRVITAKRGISGRSNNGQLTRQKGKPEVYRPKSDRCHGSNEATIAAVRAITGNESSTSWKGPCLP